jgi:hypothetical protein
LVVGEFRTPEEFVPLKEFLEAVGLKSDGEVVSQDECKANPVNFASIALVCNVKPDQAK